jgi:LysM repeat protein
MKDLRQVTLGILAALLTTALLFGSLSLALVEGTMRRALAPSATLPGSPTPAPPGFTPSATYTLPPGQPSYTPTQTPTPTLTPTSACPYPSDWIRITIQPGDTLESLADQYHTTAETLRVNNCLPTDFLVEGNQLYVPPLPQPTATRTPVSCGPYPGWVIYTIRPGDTLYSLAKYFNVTVEQLMYANCLSNSNITAGDPLYVPNLPTPTYVTPPTRTPTRTPTPSPTATLPPADTLTPTPTETETPTETPTDTPTGTPDATPTATSTLPPYPNVVVSWLLRLVYPAIYGGR